MGICGCTHSAQSFGYHSANWRVLFGMDSHVGFQARVQPLELFPESRGQSAVCWDKPHQFFKAVLVRLQNGNLGFDVAHHSSCCGMATVSGVHADTGGFTALALALGFLLPNGCLQQIAANRLSTP
jgi:hypothetical protein